MAHVRKLIRDNIESTLTGLTTTGSKVFVTRVYPISAGSLPGLAIYTRSETSDYITIGSSRSVERSLVVTVEAYVQGTTGYDDQIDQIASEVEAALATDVTRGGYAKDTRITAFDADYSADPDQPVAYASITVEVDYVTIDGIPEVAA